MKYSDRQLEHFHHAQHAGKLDENDPNVVLTKEVNGDRAKVIHLYLQIQNKKIVTAKFLAYGSVAVTACCEYVCRYLEGKTIDQAQQLNAGQMMKDLNMPEVEIHTATLVERLVKKSLH